MSIAGSYGNANAYYCTRYGQQGNAVAAACQAPEMTASLLALQTQVGHPTGNCRAYDALFHRYDWNVSLAEAICQAESGGNPGAVSPTHDYGLMQLHNLAVFDPAQNIAMAYVKYQTQGWSAWTTYNTGAYRRFL
jgi:soluble lytic murein transglycosylase-like protein